MPILSAYYPMMMAETEALESDVTLEITCRPQDSAYFGPLFMLSFGHHFSPDLNIAMTSDQVARLRDILNSALTDRESGGVGENQCPPDTSSTTSNSLTSSLSANPPSTTPHA